MKQIEFRALPAQLRLGNGSFPCPQSAQVEDLVFKEKKKSYSDRMWLYKFWASCIAVKIAISIAAWSYIETEVEKRVAERLQQLKSHNHGTTK
jgi:hypothetical protein